jgi:hypothetical protein
MSAVGDLEENAILFAFYLALCLKVPLAVCAGKWKFKKKKKKKIKREIKKKE